MSHLHANINRIKSGYNAQKLSVTLVSSKKSIQVLQFLQKNGFIKSWNKKNTKEVDVHLKYVQNTPSIKSLVMISKPSNQVYISFKDLSKIQNTHGILILDTTYGYLQLRDALSQEIGGKAVLYLR